MLIYIPFSFFALNFSLLRSVIDRAIKIPDMASTAAMAVLKQFGINGGTSTGINFIAALHLAATRRWIKFIYLFVY